MFTSTMTGAPALTLLNHLKLFWCSSNMGQSGNIKTHGLGQLRFKHRCKYELREGNTPVSISPKTCHTLASVGAHHVPAKLFKEDHLFKNIWLFSRSVQYSLNCAMKCPNCYYG